MDNQNNQGISGFSNPVPNNIPAPAPMPQVQNSNIPMSAVQNSAPTPAPMAPPPPPPVPQNPFNAAATPPAEPVASTPEMPVGLGTNQNFREKSVVGGVEVPQPKRKFSIPLLHKDKPNEEAIPQTPQPVAQAQMSAPQGAQQPPAAPPAGSAYNEVTAPGKKNQMAIIAIGAGVVLLLAAAGGYYYLTYMNKPEVPIEPEPVVEEPVVIEDTAIQEDPYILHLNQLESTASAEPASLKEHLESIELEGTNQEVITNMGTNSQTTEEVDNTMPAVENQPEAPIP